MFELDARLLSLASTLPLVVTGGYGFYIEVGRVFDAVFVKLLAFFYLRGFFRSYIKLVLPSDALLV